MRKLSLSDCRPTIARILGVCTTDSRIPDLLNEAAERLMSRGRWVGTYARYRICGNSGCITWPRQIETIEAFSICSCPGTIRNQWFEFIGNGPGVMGHDDNWCTVLVDRGEAIAFDDVVGTNKKLKVYADVAEDAAAKLFVQYYDENDNWVRTQNVDSTWNNGEYISISTIPQYSSKHVLPGGWAGVQKPVTNGVVRVYEYDTVLGTQKPLAIYEPDETRPVYRRSLVPGLSNHSGCSNSSADCETTAVTVIAKLRFIPVAEDTDLLMIGNLPALKDMCQSILKRERNLIDEAVAYEASAINELQRELQAYLGSGPVVELRVQDSGLFGMGGVTGPIAA